MNQFLTYSNLFDILPKFGAHCTTASFFSENNYFVARNTDTHPIAKYALKYAETVVVSISIPGRNKITHVGSPFMIGAITGWNDKNISIFSHQISFAQKTQLDKYSTALLVRSALEEINNISDTEKTIKKYLPNRPINLMVSDSKKKEHEQWN
jgi:hypothetical protein